MTVLADRSAAKACGPPRPRRLSRSILAAVAFLAAFAGASAAGAPMPQEPRCFGAPSMDPYTACHNPKLRLAVIPTPSEAVIAPNAACAPEERSINVCAFGTPLAKSVATVALVGNSHASHWRAAVAVAIPALRWHGLSISRSSCPFLLATVEMQEPKRRQCVTWHRGVLAWFRAHPKIATVFVSNQPTPVVVPNGQSAIGAEVAAYIRMWRALPATVQHIVVIRDNPYASENTLACVEGAIARRQPAGPACALPRSRSLKTDPEVIAARVIHSSRVQVIDLTPFFCDSAFCYPVIGGALVYRNSDHLTRVFAATLGPFLLRALGKLMETWRFA
jgi:hypothetical protein